MMPRPAADVRASRRAGEQTGRYTDGTDDPGGHMAANSPRPRDGRTQRYDETRERVIDVAARLFARAGYAATGVAQIGEEAQLARGALYYYIESKDALLAAIHDRVMDPLLREAEEINALPLSAPARLTLLSESLMDQIVHRRDHVWVFLHEYHQLEGESRRRFHDKRAAFESYVTRLLAEGAASGALQVRDLRLTTLAWFNLHNYTYQWLNGEGRVHAEVLSAQYCEIFFRGVGAHLDGTALLDEVESGRSLLKTQRDASSDDGEKGKSRGSQKHPELRRSSRVG